MMLPAYQNPLGKKRETLLSTETAVVSNLLTGLGTVLIAKAIPTVLLIIFSIASIKVLMKLADKLFVRLKVPATLLGILRAVVKVLMYFLAVIIVLSYLGVPVTSLIATMSVVGVALSLGVQNFLTNVVGGLQMLVSQPFEVEDFVEAGGCAGTVREIGLFYTKIATGDNKLVQLPNSTVVAGNIINYSSQENRRVDLVISASYGAPVQKVEDVLMALLISHPKVLEDPAPFARVSNYGPSAIDYTVRAWCPTEDYWDVYFDLIKGFKTVFDQNNIEMTYDHLNVHVVKE